MSFEPNGEKIRKAVQWFSDQKKDNPDSNLIKIADQASFQFDLSPAETEFLYNLCKKINTES